jgi:hypothetical protein
MRGPCYGGGKMSVIVAQPAVGGLSVRVATHGLRVGSIWRGAIDVADLDGVAAPQSFSVPPTRAVDGGFVVDADFGAVPRVSVSVSMAAHPDERCLSTVDTTTAATATCHGGIVIALSVVQRYAPTRLAMRFQLHGAHPGSKWINDWYMELPSGVRDGGNSWWNRAHDDGLVAARLTWVNPEAPNRSVSTSFDNPEGGQHCSIQLGTHRLPATT